MSRLLAASPDTPEGQPPPTFDEVRYLLQLSITGIRRHSEHPISKRVSILVDLAMWALSSPQSDALEGLRRAAEVLFVRLRPGLEKPIADRIEEELGHPGSIARRARSLTWLADRLLQNSRRPARATDLASTLAILLPDAYGSQRGTGDRLVQSIPWDGSPAAQSRLAKAIETRIETVVEKQSESLEHLCSDAALRAALAREVVIAAVGASEFKNGAIPKDVRERLFGAERKREKRKRSQ